MTDTFDALHIRLRPHGRPIAAEPELAAQRVLSTHRRRAAIVCGAIAAIPAVGPWLDLLALAELNLQQIRELAEVYGFEIEPQWQGALAQKLPLVRQPSLLAGLVLTAFEGEAVAAGGASLLAKRISKQVSVLLAKRAIRRSYRRLVPLISAGMSALASYRFTQALGEQALTHIAALARQSS